jgi:hypothetical protein
VYPLRRWLAVQVQGDGSKVHPYAGGKLLKGDTKPLSSLGIGTKGEAGLVVCFAPQAEQLSAQARILRIRRLSAAAEGSPPTLVSNSVELVFDGSQTQDGVALLHSIAASMGLAPDEMRLARRQHNGQAWQDVETLAEALATQSQGKGSKQQDNQAAKQKRGTAPVRAAKLMDFRYLAWESHYC